MIFHTTLHSTPPSGDPRQNTAIPFGMEKVEWWDYPMVKKLADIYNRFDSIPACDRQTTDRGTDRHLATA